jgi:hypothetical protein
MGADRFLRLHRQEVAIEHRGRLLVLLEADITGISTGKPPAAQTARFTASARSRRWVWQGLISDQVLMMPMTGFPMNSSWANPICSARSDARRSAGRWRRTSASSAGCRASCGDGWSWRVLG